MILQAVYVQRREKEGFLEYIFKNMIKKPIPNSF